MTAATTDTLTDRTEILDLLYAHNIATDALDFDGWAACFTPDGVFHGALESFRAHLDKDRIAAHARELEAKGMPRLRHFLSNTRVDVDGERATSHCFFLIVGTPDNAPSTITMVGEYVDQLVKLNGRWLFEERRVSTDGTAYTRKQADGGDQ